MARIVLRALGLLIVVPGLLVIYLFRDDLNGREPLLLLGLALSLLGFQLVWNLVRTMQELQRGLQRVSRGEAGEVVLKRPPDQIREMADIINALNRLTADFRENAAQLERFIHQFAVLTELTEITARVPDIQELLELVLQKAMSTTRAPRGATLLQREEADAFDVVCDLGWSDQESSPRLLLQELARQVEASGRPVVVEAEGSAGTVLAVPLRTKAGVVGALCLFSKPGGAFTEEDERFLTVLLAQIGFAVENARLLQHAREAAQNLRQKVQHQETQIHDAEERILRSERLWALGQLAGGIAHDFNNLLQAILACVELTERDLERPEAARPHLAQARDATHRAILVAKELLAFGRRQELKTLDVDLNRVVDEILRMVTVVLGRRIRLEHIPSPERLPVHADPRQLEHVMMNLCLNARDAMPSGGTITVSTERIEMSSDAPSVHGGLPVGRYVALSIRDTGIGMNRETLTKVFEPFFTTKAPGAGTGLGLATAYGIVRQHGGGIEVESTEGRGSTFTVLLPEVEAASEKKAA